MTKIALPNKGALAEEAFQLVEEAGYESAGAGRRQQFIRDEDNEVEFYFIRPRDIPVYVNSGIFAAGITGRDFAMDSVSSYTELQALGFGHSSFCYAVPENDPASSPAELQGYRIATSFVNLVNADLQQRGVEAKTVRLDGAVEISVHLGAADAVADIVESGRTLKQAGLRILGDPIVRSEAILMAPSEQSASSEAVETLRKRVEGVLMAREYTIIEYDIPEDSLDQACQLTPGLESPTVSPLNEAGWVAVKAMITRSNANAIMDQLSAIGAKGVLISDIKACRL